MKNFHRISTGLNVGPLMAKLARNPDWWHEDTYLRSFAQGPFGDTDSIICRFPERAVPKTEEERAEMLRTMDEHESSWLPIASRLPEVKELVMPLFAYVGGTRLGRVMINRLKPGGRVFKHADTPSHANYYRRFHIVLQSAPGVVFEAGDEQVYMATGEIWFFNNGRSYNGEPPPEHTVTNNSPIPRIHLVCDFRIED